MSEARGWWLPSEIRDRVGDQSDLQVGDVKVTVPMLSPHAVREVGHYLKQQQERVLRERTVRSIVDSLDAVALAWLDDATPERRIALGLLPRVTGFSAPMIRESIDLEQRSSTATHIWRALRSEFRDPEVLDGFVANPHLFGDGRTMAVGPALVGAVFSSNIPALPHLTVMRSLLVKSAFWGRVSSREPTFLPLYLQTLERIDSDLAGCCASLWWPSQNREVEAAFLDESSVFVGWGGVDVEHHFESVVPSGKPSIFHGHRVGFAAVDGAVVTEAIAEGIALDVCRFDQEACLSPQVVFCRGPMSAAMALGKSIGSAMRTVTYRLPPRTLDRGEATAVRQFRGAAELAPTISGGGCVVPGLHDLSWSVSVDRFDSFPMSPLHRCLSVVQIDDWADMLAMLGPMRPWLQNAALALQEEYATDMEVALARLGVSRICAPGEMATPSMIWHHDGIACLSAMVRWCDYEDRHE